MSLNEGVVAVVADEAGFATGAGLTTGVDAVPGAAATGTGAGMVAFSVEAQPLAKRAVARAAGGKRRFMATARR